MTWQPIETAPKDGTRFLAWDPGYKHIWQHHHCIEWRVTDPWSGRQMWSWAGTGRTPSHWAPLPDPPTVDPAHEVDDAR